MSQDKNKGASVFNKNRDTPRKDGSGKKDEYFNRGSQDGASHRHRVTDANGDAVYVRDNNGVEYDV